MTVCFVAVAVLAACTDEGARPTAVVQAPDSADQVLTGFSHYGTRDGVRQSHVEADTAFFYEATQVTRLKRARIVFFDGEGKEASRLTAARVIYRWQNGSMDADTNVVVQTPDGKTLRTERLVYDDGTKRFSTDKPFTYDHGTEHLEGTSFQSDREFKNVVTTQPRGVSDKGVLLPGE